MVERKHIAIVAGECNHLVIHTGLANYVRDVARAIREAGHEACVVVPHFGCIDRTAEHVHIDTPHVEKIDGGQIHRWLIGAHDKLPVVSVESNVARKQFKKMNYQATGGERLNWDDHFDSQMKYQDPVLAQGMIEFNRIAVQWLADGGPGWVPDVIHSVNWEAGLVPAWARRLFREKSQRCPKQVLTIDLLNRQGVVSAAHRPARIPQSVWAVGDDLNFLRRGIKTAHVLHLPSRQWTGELCDPKLPHSGSLGKPLRKARKKKRLQIAAFAVNRRTYDPRRNPKGWHGPLDADRCSLPELKRIAKMRLREILQLDPLDGPLFLAGNRLDPQKGYDAIYSIFPSFLRRHPQAQLVLRTLSPPDYKDKFSWKRKMYTDLLQLEEWFPGQVAVNPPNEYDGRPDVNWIHLCLAADVSMMPSRFEPCGLNHRQSLCCGTPVIGTRKGDLAVTITPQNGWLYDHPDDHGQFRWCLEDALAMHNSPDAWTRMVYGAVSTPVGWNTVVEQYLEMY